MLQILGVLNDCTKLFIELILQISSEALYFPKCLITNKPITEFIRKRLSRLMHKDRARGKYHHISFHFQQAKTAVHKPVTSKHSLRANEYT